VNNSFNNFDYLYGYFFIYEPYSFLILLNDLFNTLAKLLYLNKTSNLWLLHEERAYFFFGLTTDIWTFIKEFNELDLEERNKAFYYHFFSMWDKYQQYKNPFVDNTGLKDVEDWVFLLNIEDFFFILFFVFYFLKYFYFLFVGNYPGSINKIILLIFFFFFKFIILFLFLLVYLCFTYFYYFFITKKENDYYLINEPNYLLELKIQQLIDKKKLNLNNNDFFLLLLFIKLLHFLDKKTNFIYIVKKKDIIISSLLKLSILKRKYKNKKYMMKKKQIMNITNINLKLKKKTKLFLKAGLYYMFKNKFILIKITFYFEKYYNRLTLYKTNIFVKIKSTMLTVKIPKIVKVKGVWHELTIELFNYIKKQINKKIIRKIKQYIKDLDYYDAKKNFLFGFGTHESHIKNEYDLENKKISKEQYLKNKKKINKEFLSSGVIDRVRRKNIKNKFFLKYEEEHDFEKLEQEIHKEKYKINWKSLKLKDFYWSSIKGRIRYLLSLYHLNNYSTKLFQYSHRKYLKKVSKWQLKFYNRLTKLLKKGHNKLFQFVFNIHPIKYLFEIVWSISRKYSSFIYTMFLLIFIIFLKFYYSFALILFIVIVFYIFLMVDRLHLLFILKKIIIYILLFTLQNKEILKWKKIILLYFFNSTLKHASFLSKYNYISKTRFHSIKINWMKSRFFLSLPNRNILSSPLFQGKVNFINKILILFFFNSKKKNYIFKFKLINKIIYNILNTINNISFIFFFIWDPYLFIKLYYHLRFKYNILFIFNYLLNPYPYNTNKKWWLDLFFNKKKVNLRYYKQKNHSNFYDDIYNNLTYRSRKSFINNKKKNILIYTIYNNFKILKYYKPYFKKYYSKKTLQKPLKKKEFFFKKNLYNADWIHLFTNNKNIVHYSHFNFYNSFSCPKVDKKLKNYPFYIDLEWFSINQKQKKKYTFYHAAINHFSSQSDTYEVEYNRINEYLLLVKTTELMYSFRKNFHFTNSYSGNTTEFLFSNDFDKNYLTYFYLKDPSVFHIQEDRNLLKGKYDKLTFNLFYIKYNKKQNGDFLYQNTLIDFIEVSEYQNHRLIMRDIYQVVANSWIQQADTYNEYDWDMFEIWTYTNWVENIVSSFKLHDHDYRFHYNPRGYYKSKIWIHKIINQFFNNYQSDFPFLYKFEAHYRMFELNDLLGYNFIFMGYPWSFLFPTGQVGDSIMPKPLNSIYYDLYKEQDKLTYLDYKNKFIKYKYMNSKYNIEKNKALKLQEELYLNINFIKDLNFLLYIKDKNLFLKDFMHSNYLNDYTYNKEITYLNIYNILWRLKEYNLLTEENKIKYKHIYLKLFNKNIIERTNLIDRLKVKYEDQLVTKYEMQIIVEKEWRNLLLEKNKNKKKKNQNTNELDTNINTSDFLFDGWNAHSNYTNNINNMFIKNSSFYLMWNTFNKDIFIKYLSNINNIDKINKFLIINFFENKKWIKKYEFISIWWYSYNKYLYRYILRFFFFKNKTLIINKSPMSNNNNTVIYYYCYTKLNNKKINYLKLNDFKLFLILDEKSNPFQFLNVTNNLSIFHFKKNLLYNLGNLMHLRNNLFYINLYNNNYFYINPITYKYFILREQSIFIRKSKDWNKKKWKRLAANLPYRMNSWRLLNFSLISKKKGSNYDYFKNYTMENGFIPDNYLKDLEDYSWMNNQNKGNSIQTDKILPYSYNYNGYLNIPIISKYRLNLFDMKYRKINSKKNKTTNFYELILFYYYNQVIDSLNMHKNNIINLSQSILWNPLFRRYKSLYFYVMYTNRKNYPIVWNKPPYNIKNAINEKQGQGIPSYYSRSTSTKTPIILPGFDLKSYKYKYSEDISSYYESSSHLEYDNIKMDNIKIDNINSDTWNSDRFYSEGERENYNAY
jgi:hypothetical protein